MAERPVLVGLIPQAVVLDAGDQVSWISDAGNLRVEFDVNRCPFSSNVFQAPAGMRLLSGPARVGTRRGDQRAAEGGDQGDFAAGDGGGLVQRGAEEVGAGV